MSVLALGHCGGDDSSTKTSTFGDGGSSSGASSGGSSGGIVGGSSSGSSGGSSSGSFGGSTSSGGSSGGSSSGGDAGATCAVCDKANTCCLAMSDGGDCGNYGGDVCDLAPSASDQAAYVTYCQAELQTGAAQNIAACK